MLFRCVMNIRGKTLTVIAFSLLVSAVGNWVVLDQLAYPAFADLEQRSAMQDHQEVIEAINSEVDSISVTVWDYCNWDEAYKFANGQSPDFPDENLNAENLSKFSIDWLETYNAQRQLIFAKLIDSRKPKLRTRLVSLFPEIIDEKVGNGAAEKKGIFSTLDGMVMFAARPVLRTNGEGPQSGFFVFARYLDESVINHIRQKTNIDFDLIDLTREVAPLDAELLPKLMRTRAPLVLEDGHDNRLLTYSVLKDYLGTPTVIVRSEKERDITAIGRRVLLTSMAGIAFSAALVMGATALLLQWLLIGPLVRFTQQVVAIGRKGDLGQRVALDRADEIGTLSREFGKMLERLAEARDQSLERSYNTGLAEMAAGVLHNLRNHMTPLSMRVGRLRENLSRSPGSKLCLAYDELTKGLPDAVRKEKLSMYVELSLRDMSDRNERMLQWLGRVSDDLRHLDDTLSELERFGRSSNHLTPITLSKVLQETISQLPDYSDLNIKIEIDPRLEHDLEVLSTPFILKHVLHNLLVNACEAIAAAERKLGRIEVVQVIETTDGREMVDLQVRDNGIGIAADHLNTVFARGFTTKIGERRGTGLHWCANSVAKMDGRLFATSPGIGCGAVFHLLLPLAMADMHAAA